MAEEYNKDVVNFRKNVKRLCGELVSMTDINNDGKISKEEFCQLLKAVDLESFDEKYFDAYPKDEDGAVSTHFFLQSWIEYICNSDENNVSHLEKARLYGFRMIDHI